MKGPEGGPVSSSALIPKHGWEEYAKLCCSLDPVDPLVSDLVKKKENEGPGKLLTFHHVSGPAVRSMSLALPLLILFVMLFPVITWTTSSCPQKGGLYGTFSPWMWACAAPVLALMSWWEAKCLRIMILPYVQWLHPFKLIDRLEVSLQFWLLFNAAKSTAAKFETPANTLFVVKVVKSYTCDESLWKAAQLAWEHVISESMVHWVPWLDKLIVVCVLGWAAHVLQLLVTALMSYPTKGIRKTDYKPESEEAGYTTLCTKLEGCVHYHPGRIWHADIIRNMASATRTLSLVELSCTWQMERVKRHFDMKPPTLREQCRCFDMLFQETRRTAFRLWFMNIFEKAVIIEMQTTMFALIRATAAETDYYCLVALLIAFLGLFNCLIVSWFQWTMLRNTHKATVAKIQTFMQQQQNHEDGEEECHGFKYDFGTRFERCKAWLLGLPNVGDLPERGKVLEEARRAKRAITVRMGLGTLALSLFLIHTAAKLLMAVRFCEQGFWNIPTSRSSLKVYGCVDVSHILEAHKT